jgi:hypothetical protein
VSDLWRPDDPRFKTDIEGAGEQVVTADEGPQIRILRCTTCGTLEELPDFQGDPRDDVLLDHLVMEHNRRHPHVNDANNFLLRVSEEKWRHPRTRRAIHKQIWADREGKGFVPEYYASRSTFIEDANKCFVQHNRSIPCIDWQSDRKRIGNPTKEGWREARVKVYLCHFCPVASKVMEARNEQLGRYDD